jgi:uncharacterized integral membrane protein
MRARIIAIVTVIAAAIGGAFAFVAVTFRRIANMRLSQYAYEVADENPAPKTNSSE